MSLQSDLLELRERRRAAYQKWMDGRAEHDRACKACLEFLKAYPPKSYRLQEAYRNPDGTYAAPHWDEVGDYKTCNLIDGDELDQHIIAEGEWTEVYHNEADDPRPGCRRVIEVQW